MLLEIDIRKAAAGLCELQAQRAGSDRGQRGCASVGSQMGVHDTLGIVVRGRKPDDNRRDRRQRAEDRGQMTEIRGLCFRNLEGGMRNEMKRN